MVGKRAALLKHGYKKLISSGLHSLIHKPRFCHRNLCNWSRVTNVATHFHLVVFGYIICNADRVCNSNLRYYKRKMRIAVVSLEHNRRGLRHSGRRAQYYNLLRILIYLLLICIYHCFKSLFKRIFWPFAYLLTIAQLKLEHTCHLCIQHLPIVWTDRMLYL